MITKSRINMLQMQLYLIKAKLDQIESGELSMAEMKVFVNEVILKADIEVKRESGMRDILFELANSL